MKLLNFCKNKLVRKVLKNTFPVMKKIETPDLKLFGFLKFESRAPKTNNRMADQNTEKTIADENIEIKLWPLKGSTSI